MHLFITKLLGDSVQYGYRSYVCSLIILSNIFDEALLSCGMILIQLYDDPINDLLRCFGAFIELG